MTATAEATTVVVNCRECHRPIRATHDQIRAEIDDDVAIPCEWCEIASQPAPKPQRTAADVIVLAAAHLQSLSTDRRDDIELDDLVQEAWKMSPEKFGLKTCPRQHPSDNAVRVALANMQKRPAWGLPWIKRVGVRRYRLTPAGEARVTALEATCGNRK